MERREAIKILEKTEAHLAQRVRNEAAYVFKCMENFEEEEYQVGKNLIDYANVLRAQGLAAHLLSVLRKEDHMPGLPLTDISRSLEKFLLEHVED